MSPSFKPTLTQARLRAGQGDVSGARDVLLALLEGDPSNIQARRLLEALEGQEDRLPAEAETEPLSPLRTPDQAALTARFRQALAAPGGRERVRRLRRWLKKIRGGR